MKMENCLWRAAASKNPKNGCLLKRRSKCYEAIAELKHANNGDAYYR